MPWNLIRPYVSHYAYGRALMPAKGWPRTRVWLTHFDRDPLRLRTTRLWQGTPLHPDFRRWAERPELVFHVSEMATDKGAEPFALVYKFWSTQQEGIVVDADGELVMQGIHHTILLTDDSIAMHVLPKHAFSWIIDKRNGMDPERYEPLPVEPQGAIPDEDEKYLGKLAL